MKKFIMFTFVVIGLVFQCFAEVKFLRFQNGEAEEFLFYDANSDQEYWTKDEIIELCGDRPNIWLDGLDYILGKTFESDFSNWTERFIEVVMPMLKKYKYVGLGVEVGDNCWYIEYFLIEENKVYSRFWDVEEKTK